MIEILRLEGYSVSTTQSCSTRPFRHLLLVLSTLLISASGCETKKPEPPKLQIAAASDLETVMPILAARFKLDRGVKIVTTFGASGQLAEQIKQGAPFDLFLSANMGFVEQLVDKGHVIKDSARPYARGSLCLAVNKLSAVQVNDLKDLTKPEVHKIAIANDETAPYGIAARQTLERSNLWSELQPKIVKAGSVAQALQMVQTGNVEVAFVSRSIADIREAVVVEIPRDLYEPIVQGIGIVSRSGEKHNAELFADFLTSEEGQGILFQLGFRGPGVSRITMPVPIQPGRFSN